MRLIDADAFIEFLKETSKKLEFDKIEFKDSSLTAQAIIDGVIADLDGTSLDGFENAPTIEPEPKWIPCNARMPEEREWLGTKQFGTTISDEVFVTFENPKGERFCKRLSFQNGKLSRYDQSTIDAFYPEAKPIAWMPLPEPW